MLDLNGSFSASGSHTSYILVGDWLVQPVFKSLASCGIGETQYAYCRTRENKQ